MTKVKMIEVFSLRFKFHVLEMILDPTANSRLKGLMKTQSLPQSIIK